MILGVVLVVAGLLVGFADLMRPREQQTHVGRFFDKVATGGLGDFFLTIRRKLMENIDSFGGTRLLWLLPIVALLTWYLWRVPGGRARDAVRRGAGHPPDPARPRRGRVPRVCAQRLGDRHPGDDGGRVRVRARVRRARPGAATRSPICPRHRSSRPGAPALDDPEDAPVPQLV